MRRLIFLLAATAVLLLAVLLLAVPCMPATTHTERSVAVHVAKIDARHAAVLYAHEFSGADIGEKVNNAIAALPADGGDVIIVAGSYSYSTRIAFGNRSCVRLFGQGGIPVRRENDAPTKLIYTGSGPAILAGDGANFNSGIELHGFQLVIPTGGTGVYIDKCIEGQMSRLMLMTTENLPAVPWNPGEDPMSYGLSTGMADNDSTVSILKDDGADFVAAGITANVHKILLLRGSGRTELRTITGVTTTELTVDTNFGTKPDDTTEYLAGVTIGIDCPSSQGYSWALYDVQIDRFGLCANLNEAHGWNVYSPRWNTGAVGVRTTGSQVLSIFGGDIEGHAVSGFDIVSGGAISVTGAYHETGLGGLSDSFMYRIGSETNYPTNVSILNIRMTDGGGNADYLIELNRVRGLNVSFNSFYSQKAALLNHGGDLRNIVLDGNWLYDGELILDADDNPDYTGVVRLFDYSNNLYMMLGIPVADPGIVGAWYSDGGVITISAGP